jgi:hypothetical protein
MSFILNSNITIGPYLQVKPHEVSIVKSMFKYVDTAIIKIPISARIVKSDSQVTRTVETANIITEGMAISIELGYNGELVNEFNGFVSRVNFTTPCEIECEGYSYILRKKRYSKVFKNTTLKDILNYLIQGTVITLSPLIPDLKVAKWEIKNKLGTEVLEDLKKELTASIFFTDKELYAGLQYLQPKAKVKYRLGYNVIKDGSLKLRKKNNQELTIIINGHKEDGTKVSATFGNKGEVKKINTHAVTDATTLQMMAEAKHNKASYDGYEGKITTFLQPYFEPGMYAVIDDPKYFERAGNYIGTGVHTTYGMTGARRVIDIGVKI